MSNEPNPQDSLGEALMAGGQLDDAEAAFRKAVTLSAKFGTAWEGVAYTKFFAGDSAAGKAALDNARAAAIRPADRNNPDRIAALAALGEGNMTEGMKQLDAIEQSSNASIVDKAYVPIFRAIALVDATRYRDGLVQSAKLRELVDGGQLPAGFVNDARRWNLTIRVTAESRMGDAAAAKKTVADIEKGASIAQDDPQFQSAVHLAHGMLAAAQKDWKAAQTQFEQCSNQDVYCQWQSFVVSQKSGDSAGADAARARLIKVYVRDPIYLYARLKLNRITPKGSDQQFGARTNTTAALNTI